MEQEIERWAVGETGYSSVARFSGTLPGTHSPDEPKLQITGAGAVIPLEFEI